MARQAVFLGTDGVLNIEAGYIHWVEDLHLISGTAQAVPPLRLNGSANKAVSGQAS